MNSQDTGGPLSIGSALSYAKKQCARAPSETPLLDAQLLLQHVLQCDRAWLYTHPEQALSDAQWLAYCDLVVKRRVGQPLAHILGYREFWSLQLAVNESTLIPRPDTEVLVEQALQLPLPAQAKVLELGTGTGAIALALASERPQWTILAVDQSAEAVALAQRNRQRHAADNVAIQRSDWFSAVSGGFDLIIANPPYIDAEDPHLMQGDVRFEPASALVAAEHGYADLRYIIEHAPNFLHSGGCVMLEHGYQQGPKVREFLSETGYQKVNTVKDYANLERVSVGHWVQCA